MEQTASPLDQGEELARASSDERNALRASGAGETARQFALERYKYVLQQVHVVNENLYRFLAIYQSLATALVTAALSLSVLYRMWGIQAAVARTGVAGLLLLVTVIAGFTIVLIVVGIVNWLDYRREECALSDEFVYVGFRKPPRTGAFLHWYETYIILFIVASQAFMWIYARWIVIAQMT